MPGTRQYINCNQIKTKITPFSNKLFNWISFRMILKNEYWTRTIVILSCYEYLYVKTLLKFLKNSCDFQSYYVHQRITSQVKSLIFKISLLLVDSMEKENIPSRISLYISALTWLWPNTSTQLLRVFYPGSLFFQHWSQ